MSAIKLNKRERGVLAQVRKGEWYSYYWTPKTWRSLEEKGLVTTKARTNGRDGIIVVMTEFGREWIKDNSL